MNDITLRNLDDKLLRRLKQRAWQKGMPLDESLRLLLMEAARHPESHESDRDASG